MNSASLISLPGKARPRTAEEIGRQECELGANALGLCDELARVFDRLLHDVHRARAFDVELRHPERLHLVLVVLHAVAEEARFVRFAFCVNEYRQVAREAHRIHRFEKERAMAAEQVLHIVLRRHEQHVHAGVVHQPVQPFGVERRCVLSLGNIEHDRSPDRSLDRPLGGEEAKANPALA